MKKVNDAREELLAHAVTTWEGVAEECVQQYCEEHYRVKRGAALRHIVPLWGLRGLQSFFVNESLDGLKQSYYIACKLLMASQQDAESEGDVFATYEPFLYGLLCDSSETFDWLSHAELKNKNEVQGSHFFFHQLQLVLRCDDDALRDTIAIVAKKGGKLDKSLAQQGDDFFSLLLKKDKEGLQIMIKNYAKIKPIQELDGKFLAGFAAVHAKLCWHRGILVEIQSPLVPMPLMPIQPLNSYDVKYDFLRPGWTPPPPPGFWAQFKRLF